MGYCQSGDTARVTFPDGSSRDFAAPIDITCEDGALEPNGIPVDVCIRVNLTVRFISRGRLVTTTQTYTKCSTSFSGMQVGIPVLGLRTRSESNNGQTYLELLASYGAAEPSWAIWDNWSTETTTGTFSIISIKKRFAPNQGEDYLKKIITVRQGAQELHKGQHDSCAFSVECIKPCPPNTLDCGGCCLDCAGIFNQLSALTKKVLSMK